MTPTRRTRQRILKAIERDRTDIDMPLRVIEWRTWPSVNRWGHVGEVEVEYSTRGYRAIYGFDALGNTTIYMD